MKNDVSFVIDSSMVLLEHQSSYNPNMPLRGFLYFAKLYQKHIEKRKEKTRIYSSQLLIIPTPRYIVLYNGKDRNIPDKLTMKLSDAFENPDKSGNFEWTATMLNINTGHNENILLKCKKLDEYSRFIELVRHYQSNNHELKEAIDLAIEEAIKVNILSDFLKSHKAEVKMCILTEFDEQEYYNDQKNIISEMSKKIADMQSLVTEKENEIIDIKSEIAKKDNEIIYLKKLLASKS